jgi:SOS-response transcriptional repressor LexA
MTKKPPSPREREILLCIHRYASEHDGNAPTPREIAVEIGINLKYVLTIIGRLKLKELVRRIDERVLLIMDNVEEYLIGAGLPIRPLSVVPAQLLCRGKVKAGRTGTVVIFDDRNDRLHRIPDANLEKETYLLEVVGRSMEHEKIFEGDFIVVESFSGIERPAEGEIIVANYIEYEEDANNFDDSTQLSPLDYQDLTVKVFVGEIPVAPGEQKLWQLSWKKEKEINPYEIKAIGLRPIGRVIGVYRDLRKRNSQKFTI